jgi:hypothetical protein
MDDNEQQLTGGNVSNIVRIGDRVHRQTNPWSPAVHELLRYLESHGFKGAPRFLGLDDQGREMLSFIEGEVGNDPVKPYMWAETVLIDVARMLRTYHDLTVDFLQLYKGRWQLVFPDESRHEVICHNDVAPYNTVFVDQKPIALIDFDTAGPGPRIWDLAYALYRFVPLSRFGPGNDGELIPYNPAIHRAERRRRIRLFCHAYGWEDVGQLPDAVELRLKALCEVIKEKAAAGDEAYRRMIEEGHLDYYREEIDFHRQHYPDYFGE